MTDISHFNQCKARAAEHADVLAERIRAGLLNASAFESLMRIFLEQPAYRDYRRELLDIALTRLDGRRRHVR